MAAIIKLPSGKLIDLSRFVALIPDDNTTKTKYKLSLDGLNETIDIDSIDAEFISRKLELELDINNHNLTKQWDKEAQLHKNQPLMKLIEQWKEEKNGQTATSKEIQEYQEIQESLRRNRSIERI